MSKKVFTNGCFDVLHVGHINLLLFCQELAGPDGIVVVALDTDQKIEKDKGVGRPIFSYVERSRALSRLRIKIGRIISFSSNEDLYKTIKEEKPDIIVKGSDWKGNVIGSDLAEVVHFDMLPNFSSTSIIQRILSRTLSYDFRNEALLPHKE